MDKLDKIAIGTVQFGLDYGISNDGGKVSKEKVVEILSYAKKVGISYLDTAQAYNSESVLGDIEESQSFKLISKFSNVNLPINKIFKQSLALLKTKRVYGYLAHSFSVLEKNREHYNELIKYKREGLIHKVGVSIYHPSEAQFILDEKIEVDLVQLPYSIFDQRFNDILPKLKEKGIEVHSRSTFLQGLMFLDVEKLHPYFNPVKKKLVRFHSFCDEMRLDVSIVALNYVFANPFIDKVVLGITSVDELKSNISALKCFEDINSRIVDVSKFEIKDDNILLPYLWKIK